MDKIRKWIEKERKKTYTLGDAVYLRRRTINKRDRQEYEKL